jgi:hypothetical protein
MGHPEVCGWLKNNGQRQRHVWERVYIPTSQKRDPFDKLRAGCGAPGFMKEDYFWVAPSPTNCILTLW